QVVEFSKFECTSQFPDIVQINCSINRTSANISALFVDFMLFEDIYDANGIFTIFLKHGSSYVKYDTQVIDYCTVLGNLQNQYLFQSIISEIRHISNIPLTCPFKKNKKFYVKGFKIGAKVVPKYFPNFYFTTETTFNSNGKRIGFLKTFGQIKQK
ncbi:hypothetical protein KR222_005133, partial [Zaprionus bogoriensis]